MANEAINRLDEINALLDEYQKSIYIPRQTVDSKIEEYLNLTREQIRKLSPEDCGEIAYVVSRFASYIQEKVNRQTAVMGWAEANIKIIIADKIDQYTGYGYEEKKNKAIKDNEVARELEKVRTHAKLRSDELFMQAQRIEFMAKLLNDMKFIKAKQHG